MHYLIFDIETTALPVDSLGHLAPDVSDITAPSNYKDPDKVASYIEAKKEEKLASWKSKLALHPETSRLAAYGIWIAGVAAPVIELVPGESGEAAALSNLWQWLESSPHIIGHNVLGFDMPWLVKRSALVGVRVPAAYRPDSHGYFNKKRIADTMAWWEPRGFISLNRLASIFGLETKALPPGKDVTTYAKWPKEEQEAYLVSDLRITLQLAERFGLATTESPSKRVSSARVQPQQDIGAEAARRLDLSASQALEELDKLPTLASESTSTQNSHRTALSAHILVHRLRGFFRDDLPPNIKQAADAAWEAAAHSWVLADGGTTNG